jgi:hypothetical protein
MAKQKKTGNIEVTEFLDAQNHPLRTEIEKLRQLILSAEGNLIENVKWNGPNYSVGDDDRITMKIQPPKNIQLIFHRGAKVKKQPANKLIQDNSGLLLWKENDRAVATFKNTADIESSQKDIVKIVKEWVLATS